MANRLFVAIDLPDATRRLLVDLDPHIRGVRWTDPPQMHLTLAFFADVSQDVDLALLKNLARSSLARSFCLLLVLGPFLQKALRKLSGSVSATRTRICFKSTNACRKPRSPRGSIRSCARGILTSRLPAAVTWLRIRCEIFSEQMPISMRG